MNKPQLLELISDAIDKGASISIHLGQYSKNWEPINAEQALATVEDFAFAIGTENIDRSSNGEINVNSFVVDNGNFRVTASYIPGSFMEEDVDLSGDFGNERKAV